MRVVVCVKQIPDPATPYELDPDSHFVIRPDDQVLDDTDRYGIEVGLQIKEAHGGSVTLVTMGPAGSMQGIRQALAMGPDKAIVIDDPALRGADALTTARMLAAAITNEGFDVVVAGTESTDGYSGVLPQQLAELLDVPSLTFARKVTTSESSITIERQTADGYDVVEAATPALLSVTAGAVEPRYSTFQGIIQAKNKPVETYTAGDLGLDVQVDQQIVSVEPVPARAAGEIVEDDGTGHDRIVSALEQAKVI